jgi:predicted TPR repeat methyltransferase
LTTEVLGDIAATAQVLDMGCGTGLVGQYLKERGFLNVVGVDASKGMLDKATEKRVYSELVELFLGKPETFPKELRNRFDAITASGILAEGHLDNSIFDEMMLSLKTGGFAVFATRTMYLTQYDYASKIEALTTTGIWKLIKEITFDRYDQLEVEVGRFKKVEVKAFVF